MAAESKSRLSGPEGAPYAWAESRQEVCETLPYYRSYHSGCYATSALTPSTGLKKTAYPALRDFTPYGYLLAGFDSCRDVWHNKGRVIISHGGGSSAPVDSSDDNCRQSKKKKGASNGDTKRTRQVQLVADQSMNDLKVASLLHSLRHQTPVVLLLSKDYKLSHFELPCAFAVLGWYWITDSWCEREAPSSDGNHRGWIRWKFRFQYIESQGSPWWLHDEGKKCWHPSDHPIRSLNLRGRHGKKRKRMTTPSSVWSSSRYLQKPEKCSSIPIADHTGQGFDCPSCGQISPVVFTRGWMCVYPACTSFWNMRGSVPKEDDLTLSSYFLESRPEPLHFQHGGLPFSLEPHVSRADLLDTEQGDALRGFHCMCGRLSCRQYADHWRCAHCGLIKPCTASVRKHVAMLTATTSRMEDSKINAASRIKSEYKRWPQDDLEVGSYLFPEELGGGSVHVIQSMSANDLVADSIFLEMQKSSGEGAGESDDTQSSSKGSEATAVPFRRHPLICGAVKGDLLSQQFTCNYGVEYKHTVKMSTTSLNDAPSSAHKAMEHIKERTRKVIQEEQNELDFNELYPVKYVENQKMNFHDDGEPGLGTVIASLSLGREAKMMFRLKEKYAVDYRRGSKSTEVVLHEDLVEEKGFCVGNVHNDTRPKIQGDSERKEAIAIKSANRLLLTIPLRHGCVAIQHGRGLQEMIEHAVQPVVEEQENAGNQIRIAVTARRINNDGQKETSPKKVASSSSTAAVTATTTPSAPPSGAPSTVMATRKLAKRGNAFRVQSIMKLPGGVGWTTN
ncbi:hypothetical protein CBS101457_004351 [Exobasidium rhododendri]|nr:hypothetical protein CBS101457_004351 [Exobasidium rhododendri]